MSNTMGVLLETGTAYPSRAHVVTPSFWLGPCYFIFLFSYLCCVCLFVCFCFMLCLCSVWSILHVFLDCTSLITPSAYSNIYLPFWSSWLRPRFSRGSCCSFCSFTSLLVSVPFSYFPYELSIKASLIPFVFIKISWVINVGWTAYPTAYVHHWLLVGFVLINISGGSMS
jgi:hypothetical protein